MLVDRHSPRLLAVVRRLLATDASGAEDVLQQSWVNGISALASFRRDACFSTWMTRIAIHAALDHLRTRSTLRDCAACLNVPWLLGPTATFTISPSAGSGLAPSTTPPVSRVPEPDTM